LCEYRVCKKNKNKLLFRNVDLRDRLYLMVQKLDLAV
jgi:hypothetical protein